MSNNNLIKQTVENFYIKVKAFIVNCPTQANLIIFIILLLLFFAPISLYGFPNWSNAQECYISCK